MLNKAVTNHSPAGVAVAKTTTTIPNIAATSPGKMPQFLKPSAMTSIKITVAKKMVLSLNA